MKKQKKWNRSLGTSKREQGIKTPKSPKQYLGGELPARFYQKTANGGRKALITKKEYRKLRKK